MFDIGGPELIVIVLFVLILFGPKKIPEVAQTVGKGLRKIKEAQAQFQSQINEIQKDVKSVAYPETDYSIETVNKTNIRTSESDILIDQVYMNKEIDTNLDAPSQVLPSDEVTKKDAE